MDVNDPGVRWLQASKDPSVRFLLLRDVLGPDPGAPEVRAAADRIARGPRVRALLSGQHGDGGFGGHPYAKWTGAHWRLVSLVELGIPPGHPAAVAAAQHVLAWIAGDQHRRRIVTIGGLTRRCASQEGNALAVCSRLGLANDPRVAMLAESLVSWQWPDGGWNCDPRIEARHSSFHESLAPVWGLLEYHRATGNDDARTAALRACELFLRHRFFRSERTGDPVDHRWLKFRYPPYWHYDVLQGLRVVGMAAGLADPRAAAAMDVVLDKRSPDGRWAVEGCWWKPPDSPRTPEVVDWGRTGPNEFVTLNALRVLRMRRPAERRSPGR